MNRHALCLLAVLMAGWAGGDAAAQTGEQTAAAPAGREALAAQPRAKTATEGAQLAEQWSPFIGAALTRFNAAPTVGHEIELAHAYYGTGILDQAFEHYQAAARRAPREAAAWDGQARIWRDWGYPQLGLADAYRAVYAQPRSPILRNTLGTILQLMGQPREASRQFARAVSLDPSAAYAHYNLAVAHAALQEYDAAAVAFERAVALDPALAAAQEGARDARRKSADATGKGGSHERR